MNAINHRRATSTVAVGGRRLWRSVVRKSNLIRKFVVQFCVCFKRQRLTGDRLESLFYVQCFLCTRLKVRNISLVCAPLLCTLWHHLRRKTHARFLKNTGQRLLTVLISTAWPRSTVKSINCAMYKYSYLLTFTMHTQFSCAAAICQRAWHVVWWQASKH